MAFNYRSVVKVLECIKKCAKYENYSKLTDITKDFTTSYVSLGNHPISLKMSQNSKIVNQEVCMLSSLCTILPRDATRLRLLRSHPRCLQFDETFVASHAVYHKYQTTVHGDPPSKPSERQYTNFLVNSPLIEDDGDGSNVPGGYGSFHQHYILDGKIIGVGVIDILPRCVSSVYFYYDPDYAFLTLGTYSALRELAFTRQLSRSVPQIAYYYLGFYVHSCPKMRYKGQYAPSFLCCPETYTWHPLSECSPKLDVSKYSRFAPPSVGDEDEVTDISDILCLYKNSALAYSVYVELKKKLTKRSPTDADEVKQYAQFVGGKCAPRMLLARR